MKGYPALIFLDDGIITTYDGERNEKNIVKWLQRNSLPMYTTISTVAELEKLQENKEAVVLGVFTSETDQQATSFIEYIDSSAVDRLYAFTSSDEIRKHLNAKPNTIVVLKDFIYDDKRSDFYNYDKSKNQELDVFLSTESVPLVQEFNNITSHDILYSGVNKLLLIFSDPTQSFHANIINSVKPTAIKYKGKMKVVSIATVDTNKESFDTFGINKSEVPKIVAVNMESSIKKYLMESTEITSSSINKHVDDFLNGKLKSYVKSQKIEPSDLTGNVKIIKGSNFRELVIDSDYDVMLEIYAPWCGHCRKLGKFILFYSFILLNIILYTRCVFIL